ncbi:hypothetical protein ACFUNF_20685 [Streptomyces sp. NPDC057291]|uniref:hypothetical protein n=1 Tax=Streptomyces sp. NPDC057291 TaxID=3346087 RepID=UPI0036362341
MEFVPGHALRRSTPTECGGTPTAQSTTSAGGFADTDLDVLLKQHHVSKDRADRHAGDTCIETTARFAESSAITSR